MTFTISTIICAYIILTSQMQITTLGLRIYLNYLPFYVLRDALMKTCFLTCESQNPLSFSFLYLYYFSINESELTLNTKQFILSVCNQQIIANQTRLISFQE